MSGWKQFEIDWTKFLQKMYGNFAHFEHIGEEDSTRPDILVRTLSGNDFFIEAKKCPAQCGQFVLHPDNIKKKFVFSNKNDTKINSFAKIIIDFMSNHFDDFKDAGTAGRTIEFDNMETVFANWIMKTYKNKNVQLFGTNDHVLILLDDFPNYFNVTAKYRIKRSGSRNVGKNSFDKVKNFVNKNFNVDSFEENADGSLFCLSTHNLHNQRFRFEENEFMFKYKSGKFEIRKLSNTFNANVIFSITLKAAAGHGMTKKEIIDYLTSK